MNKFGLKPCPFCGDDDVMIVASAMYPDSAFVFCFGCGTWCPGKAIYEYVEGCRKEKRRRTNAGLKECIAAAWNRRAKEG